MEHDMGISKTTRAPDTRTLNRAGERPMARWIIALALVVLGGLAAVRIPIAYLPTWSFPELRVSLRLAESGEVGDTTRRWIVPLETAIRAVGGVRSTAGEVDGEGGWFRVRFRPGTEIERKAARLESELGELRRQLPRGARLDVRPSSRGAGENAALVWVPGEQVDPRLVEAVESLPAVRQVQVGGRASRELWVRAHRAAEDGSLLRQAIERHLTFEQLGTLDGAFDDRRRSVWLSGGVDGSDLARVPVAVDQTVTDLSTHASLSVVEEEPPWAARRQGEPGVLLFIARELDSSPLALSRSLRTTLGSHGYGDTAYFFIDEAEPLERLLRRLGMGAVAAMVALALACFWLGGAGGIGVRWALTGALVLPVSAAGALQALWLADEALDLTTLPALAIALAGALGFFALRLSDLGRGGTRTLTLWVTASLAGAMVPVATALAGGELAPMLLAPARTLALGFSTAMLASWVLPLPRWVRRPAVATRGLAWIFRRGGTVALLASTALYGCFVLFGDALAPKRGSIPGGELDLSLFVDLPRGGTLDQARRQVELIERHLDELDAIDGHWSFYNRFGATLGLTVAAKHQGSFELRALVRRLQAELGGQGVSVQVVPYGGGSREGGEPVRFSAGLEDEASIDEEFFDYRLVLRATDLDALRRTHERLLERLQDRWEIWERSTRSDWRQPTTQLELIPHPGVDAGAVQASLRAIAHRSQWPVRSPLAGDRQLYLRVLGANSPRSEDDVPSRTELLTTLPIRAAVDGEPTAASVGALFDLREVVASPGLRRQAGRFVLPVNLRIRGSVQALREENAKGLHWLLNRFTLHPGVDLELPVLSSWVLRRERLRMVWIASTLPLLLLALTICRLDAVGKAFAAMLAPFAGLAMAAPIAQGGGGRIDEMSLFALAAALACGIPVTLEVADRCWPRRRTPLAGGMAYRWLSWRWPAVLVAILGVAVLLAVPTVGLDTDRNSWVLPLRLAAVATAVVWLSSCLLVPVVLGAGRRLKERDPEAEQAIRHPPEWREPGPLELSTRHLTKVYKGGFKALHGVEFRLEPGVVGLLGPNGAGKTTLLRLLCGLLEPSRGQVLFRGVPITADNLPEYRRLVGFLPQDFNAYEGMTAANFLDYWALEKGVHDRRIRRDEVEKVLDQVGLSDAAGRRVRQFSGGMRRRIGIARALLGDPPLVIVDEPTTGLDVESRNRLRDTLLSVAGERVIVFSTHIASDVAAVATRILLLHRGRLLFDGAARGLVDRAEGRVFEALLDDQELREFSNRYRVTTRVRTLEGIRVRAVVTGDQEPAGRVVVPNLEEAYLAVLGELDPKQLGSGEGSFGHASTLLDIDHWRS